MKKKYVSPIVEALDLELENVLYDSTLDNEWNDADEPVDDDFDKEEDFVF